jgi:hypothetical protein
VYGSAQISSIWLLRNAALAEDRDVAFCDAAATRYARTSSSSNTG